MPPAGGRTTPPIFFPEKENGRCDRPKERRLIGSPKLEQPLCLRNATACVRRSRVSFARRFASASTTRCRSVHLIEEQPNSRLPPVATMRRAPAMPLFRTQSAARQTSLAPHDSKARLIVVTIRRDSWRSHVHRTRLRSACSSSRLRLPMQTPFFWTGDARFLSTERKWGSRSCSAYGAASPRHKCRDPLRTCAKKGAFYGTYNESHCQNPL